VPRAALSQTCVSEGRDPDKKSVFSFLAFRGHFRILQPAAKSFVCFLDLVSSLFSFSAGGRPAKPFVFFFN
jgi:hypothetical protein